MDTTFDPAAASPQLEVSTPSLSPFDLSQLAMVVHELRTPLLAIQGCNQAAQLETTAEQREQSHRQINAMVAHMLDLVNDILLCASTGNTDIPISNQPVSTCRLLGDVIAATESLARMKDMHIVNTHNFDFPAQFSGDPLRLRQVLINLLANAIKYSPPETEVRLSACLDLENKALQFVVEDSGPGMTATDLANIFRPFTRLARTASGSAQGTGLGLAVSNSLVQAMGGEISVTSTPGHGSVFTVNLPYCSDLTGEEVLGDFESDRGDDPGDNGSPLNVLLVEDNELLRDILFHYLTRSGHSVTACESGEDAIEQVAADSFDLILIDYNLGELNGIDTARLIRAGQSANQAQRIVGMSAVVTDAQKAEAKEAGMDDFLLKASGPRELMAMISAAIGKG